MPLQYFILSVAVIGAGGLLRPPDLLRWLFPPAAFALLVLEGLYHGLYWPMLPACLVLAVCAVLLPLRPVSARLGSRQRVLALGALLCCTASFVLLHVLPLFRLPAPTGLYSVGTRTEHWIDPATHRELVVQFWYPAAPVGRRARYMLLAETRPQFAYWHWIRTNSWQDAPLAALGSNQAAPAMPLLLFGPMWGGRRTQDTFLAEELASHGYLVAAVDHPGNSARILLGDGSVLRSDRAKALSNLEATTAPAIRALWTGELALWTADNEYVLDTLTEHPPAFLAGHIDHTRIGAFGHSFGGSASMALLGTDKRVHAALNMDGWTFDGLDHRTTELVLFLYAGAPPASPQSASVDDQLERQDLESVNASLAAQGGCEAYLRETQHADFTDQTLISPVQHLTYTGPLSPLRVRPIVRGLVLGFFDQALKQQGSLPTYPEVQTTCR